VNTTFNCREDMAAKQAKSKQEAPPPRVEVYVFGHVLGARLDSTSLDYAAHALGLSTSAALCSYRLVAGKDWALGKGSVAGTSHTDCPASEPGAFLWEQPFDASFVGCVLDGWLRIELEVRTVDAHGRSELAGYAYHHVPSAAGTHALRCPIWRPRGTLADRLSTFFLGAPPQLKEQDLVYGRPGSSRSLSRSNGRDRIVSVSGGEVFVSISVTMRESPPAGVEQAGGLDKSLAVASPTA
jgi:B9 domain-containing protein 2